MSSRVTVALSGVAALVVGLTVLGLGGSGLDVVGQEKLDQRLEPGRLALSDVVGRLTSGEDTGRYALYVALAEEAPGTVAVLLDADLPFDATAFGVFGDGAGTIEASAVTAGETLRRAAKDHRTSVQLQGLATRAGAYRDGGTWYDFELHVLAPPVPALTIEHADVLYLIDVRLLGPEAARSLDDLGELKDSGSARPLRARRPGVIETAVMMLMLILGGLLIPRTVLTGPVRPAAALIAGLALQSALGAFARGWAVLLLPIAAGALFAVLLRRRGDATGWTRRDVPALALATGVIGACVALTREFGLVHVSTDTAGYLERAVVRARATTALVPPSGRSSGYEALHAAGHLVGADVMFAVGPLALIAGLVLIAGLALRAPRQPHAIVAFVVVAGVLVGTDFIRRITMLLNSHMVVAVFLLLIAVLWLELDAPRDPPRTLAPVAAVLAAAVVLGRPEGIAYIALFLAGTLGRECWQRWRPVWLVAGMVVLAQVLGGVAGEMGGLDRTGSGLLAVGLALVVAPFVLGLLPLRLLGTVPALALLAPWILLLAVRTEDVQNQLANARSNLFGATGGWELSAVSLLLLVGIAAALWAVALRRGDGGAATPLWTLVLAYPPVVLLIRGFAQGGVGGRAHWHDSVNRMWVHLLLLLALLIVVSVRARPEHERGEDASSGARGLSLLAVAAAIGAVVLPALAWVPAFAREQQRVEVLAVEQREWDGRGIGDGWRLTGIPGPELTGIQSVLTTVPLDLGAVDAVSLGQPGELCVSMRLRTFERDLTGLIELTVTSGDLDTAGEVAVDELEDHSYGVARAPLCFVLAEEDGGIGALGDDATITVRGRGTFAGAAPAVVLDSEGDPVVSVELRWSDPARAGEPFVRHGPRVAAVITGLLVLIVLLEPGRRRSR